MFFLPTHRRYSVGIIAATIALFLANIAFAQIDTTVRPSSGLQGSIAQRIASFPKGIAFENKRLSQDGRDPVAGAEYTYQRVGSQISRQSPVDIEILLLDKNGRSLHHGLEKEVRQIYGTIYRWDPKLWQKALEEHSRKQEIITAKSNFFWESLAQHVAEYVFDRRLSPRVYIHGPQANARVISDTVTRLTDVVTVIVRTHIDGRRDPLNPITRRIVYIAHRGKMEYPEILLDVEMPVDLRIASAIGERLDMRPKIGDSYSNLKGVNLFAQVPSSKIKRTQNTDYPDFNLLYIPLRHLVFQGDVSDPTRSKSALSYPTRNALRSKVHAVLTQLRRPALARRVADKLKGFLNKKYYYMFDQGTGLESYKTYILGPHGIAGSISPHIATVQLQLR